MNNYQSIVKQTEKIEKELKELAYFIHQNPELGMQEYKACEAQVNLLSKYGFAVEKGICGLETAYRAVYKGKQPGPKIAMLAEYDALPELGHACGHNLIAMVGVGAGILIKDLVEEYGGEIYVFGTPAEETAGAKVQMAEEGAFDDMDIAMMAHPMNENYDSVNTMAVNAYTFEFFGKTAHAAAAPEEGKNALDAMINFYNLVNALRQQTKEDARIQGIITNGGAAPNIIPDYTSAKFYVRANQSAYLETLCEKVIKCAQAAAMGTGTTEKHQFVEVNFKDTRSNRTLSDLHTAQMEAMGVDVIKVGGRPMPGSSDLGDVSYVCPAIQCTFNIMEENNYGAHTTEFAECAGTDKAMDMGIKYIQGFAMTAAEILTNPEYLEKIKIEFHNN